MKPFSFWAEILTIITGLNLHHLRIKRADEVKKIAEEARTLFMLRLS